MIYRSHSQLKGNTLKPGDGVILGENLYVARIHHMENIVGYNDLIFDELGVHERDLLDDVYGYRSGSGVWSECNSLDYDAMTRACLVLLAFCEGKDTSVVMPDGNVKTFLRSDYMNDTSIILEPSNKNFVVLNENYAAVITGEVASVGCQNFSYETIKELYEEMTKLRDE